MQYSQSDSGSDSDDAPEEITVSSAKKGSKQAQKAEREFVAQYASHLVPSRAQLTVAP